MPENDPQSQETKRSSGPARVAMWLGGSAFFGSLALVLWNRRTLIDLRKAAEARLPPVRPMDDDDIY